MFIAKFTQALLSQYASVECNHSITMSHASGLHLRFGTPNRAVLMFLIDAAAQVTSADSE